MVAAFDESVCTWERVEMYIEWCGTCRSHCSYCKWGARLQPTSDVQISVDYNDDQFRKILCGGVAIVAGTEKTSSGYPTGLAQQIFVNDIASTSPPSEDTAQKSQLTAEEKEFLKLAKKYREIRKLAKLDPQELNPNQRDKLKGESETLAGLRSSLQRLPGTSELRTKNADIVTAVESP